MLLNNIKRYIPEKIKVFIAYYKFKYRNLLHNRIDRINSDGRLILLLSPTYSNLGDIAIYLATIDYFSKEEKVRLAIPTKTCLFRYKISRQLKKDDIILLQGGGNLGDRYFTEELIRAKVVSWFPNNKIICMPQTISFGHLSSDCVLAHSISKYRKHKDMYILCRDTVSLEFAKKTFRNAKVLLMPDIVLSSPVKRSIPYRKNNSVLLCLRDDIEVNNDEYLYRNIVDIIKDNNMSIAYFDTDNRSGLDIADKKAAINGVLSLFQKYELIITDRLHGAIFSYITQTPCIVLPTNDHKLIESFKWFEGCNYMFFAYSIENIVYSLRKISELTNYQEVDYSKYFIKLEDIIDVEK